ncbi:50S ribosomal protein L23 [Candidatus Saccharibacteria bacterium]|jgi:large subunit ribosomal protein L23|nr:50S ribosomal protein L23 [Candidatus Saccharibacteria bacterium]
MLLIPRVSEKAYAQNLAGTYVFEVPLTANKAEIKKALESEFSGVKIKDIRLVVAKGKAKVARRGKRARPGVGKRNDFKKAYITLLEGKIEIAAFKAEEPDAKAKTEEKPAAAKTKGSELTSEKSEPNKGGLFAKRRTGRRGDK